MDRLWAGQDKKHNASGGKEAWHLAVGGGDGQTVGGAEGYFRWGWSYVRSLIVDPALRGKGGGGLLMRQAEELARARGMKGLHLQTLSFQAPDFYRKWGFEVVGKIEDMPPG